MIKQGNKKGGAKFGSQIKFGRTDGWDVIIGSANVNECLAVWVQIEKYVIFNSENYNHDTMHRQLKSSINALLIDVLRHSDIFSSTRFIIAPDIAEAVNHKAGQKHFSSFEITLYLKKQGKFSDDKLQSELLDYSIKLVEYLNKWQSQQ